MWKCTFCKKTQKEGRKEKKEEKAVWSQSCNNAHSNPNNCECGNVTACYSILNRNPKEVRHCATGTQVNTGSTWMPPSSESYIAIFWLISRKGTVPCTLLVIVVTTLTVTVPWTVPENRNPDRNFNHNKDRKKNHRYNQRKNTPVDPKYNHYLSTIIWTNIWPFFKPFLET